jgi:hypothetical protein
MEQSAVLVPFAPWTPDAIAPAGWYDASDAATITSSNGAVSHWTDKSGNGLNLSQSNQSLRPLTGSVSINGGNAIKFDGDTLISSSNPFAPLIQDAMVMAVHRVDALATGSTLFSLSGSIKTASRWQAHAPWGSEVIFDTGGTSAGRRVSNSYGTAVGDIALLGLYGSTTNNVQQIYKNGVLLRGDTSGHSVATIGNISVGSGANTQFQRTSIGEIVILNGTVSTDDRQKLEGYLAHKWGLEARLPATHPYKADPTLGVTGADVTVELNANISAANTGIMNVQWSLVSGPAAVAIADIGAPSTTATFTAAGTYVMRLTANDGIDQNHADVTIHVKTANHAVGEIPVAGSVSGTVENVDSQDNLYQVITEISQGGTSLMEHVRVFELPEDNTSNVYVEAHHSANLDGAERSRIALKCLPLIFLGLLSATGSLGAQETTRSFDFGTAPGKTSAVAAGFSQSLTGSGSFADLPDGLEVRVNADSAFQNFAFLRSFAGLGGGQATDFSISTEIRVNNLAGSSHENNDRWGILLFGAPGSDTADTNGISAQVLARANTTTGASQTAQIVLRDGVSGSILNSTNWVGGPILQGDALRLNVVGTYLDATQLLLELTLSRGDGSQAQTIATTITGTKLSGTLFGGALRIKNGRAIEYDTFSVTVESPGLPLPPVPERLVAEGAGGLIYSPYANQGQTNAVHTVPDYSRAGYMGGGVALPFVPSVVVLEPAAGDDGARIQGAINSVAAMPLGPNGFRGAILLKAGDYEVASTLNINASGIVIRGEGSQENGGTRIIYTATTQSNLFHFHGSSNPVLVSGSGRAVVGPSCPLAPARSASPMPQVSLRANWCG